MKTKIKNINDFVIEPFDILEFYEYVGKNAINIWGYGQDAHSVEGTPTFCIFKLRKKDWIKHNGEFYKAIAIDYSKNEIYLEEDYQYAKFIATDYDNKGKGFRVELF